MPSFRASAPGRADFREIGAYTVHCWDEAQADKYLGELEAFCQHLAEGRGVGRACDDVSPGLFRIDYASNVVFYRSKP